MAGIKRSARAEYIDATCGHKALVVIPPGELGEVGRRRVAEAQGRPCFSCRESIKVCSSCNGTGYYDNTDNPVCGACLGTGRVDG